MALSAVVAELATDGEDYDIRFAVLDADPQQTNDLFLGLACLGTTQFAYLVPYGTMPANTDSYTHGIWDDTSQMFVDGGLGQIATLTDDGEAVYIQNRAVLASMLGMLQRGATGSLPRGQMFYAGTWATSSDDAGLGAEFDPDGLEDALAYLSCF